MAQISGNTCEVITLLPLGVICETTNSSTPQTPNGSIFLQITGGSSPYMVTWDNGGQGRSLINLKSGDYGATVVDYYGDYTATTICSVGFNSFFLDWFEDCENVNNYLYYVTQQPSIFTSGFTYQLNGQSGCWSNLGTTLWTGQTFINDFASVSSGPFDTCEECLPEPIPTPIYPQYICLRKDTSPFTQFTFESGSTITNSFPVWSETGSTGYNMVYRGNGTWLVVFGVGDALTLNKATAPPIGAWKKFGTSETWTSVSGSCPSIPPPSIQLELDNPSCQGVSDGSIIVTASEGVSPYQYSLDGTNYQTSPRFNNLSAGAGTIYVRDTTGEIVSKTYVLINESRKKSFKPNYSTFNKSVIQNSSNVKEEVFTIGIDVNDTVESPDELTFDFTIAYNFSIDSSVDNSPNNNPQLISGITVNTTSNYSVTNVTRTLITNNSGNRGNGQPFTSFTWSNQYKIKVTGDTTQGSISFVINNGGTTFTVPSTDYVQKINSNITGSIRNLKLTNVTKCSEVTNTSVIIPSSATSIVSLTGNKMS
jgi:hypothetical protein